MTLTLNNTNTLTADNIVVGGTNLSDLYATINYVNTNAGGGVSQADFDNSITALQSKDIAYNNTLTSHISLIDTNANNIEANTTDISILNKHETATDFFQYQFLNTFTKHRLPNNDTAKF